MQHKSQRVSTEVESRCHLMRALDLGDGVLEATGHGDLYTVKTLEEQVQRIELECALDLRGAFLCPTENGQEVRVESFRLGVVGVELERPFERQFSLLPVPLVPGLVGGEPHIRLGESVIQLEGLLDCHLRLRYRLGSGHRSKLATEAPNTSDSGVGQSIIGIDFKSRVEILKSLLEILWCELLQVKHSPQIGLVCRRIDLAGTCKEGLLVWGQGDFDLPGDGPRDLTLERQNACQLLFIAISPQVFIGLGFD